MIKNPPPGEGEQWVAKWNEMTPVGRFADPKEIGDTLVLLCSDKASTFMTGHDLVIDGGMYIEIATGDGTHWLPRIHYLLIQKYRGSYQIVGASELVLNMRVKTRIQ